MISVVGCANVTHMCHRRLTFSINSFFQNTHFTLVFNLCMYVLMFSKARACTRGTAWTGVRAVARSSFAERNSAVAGSLLWARWSSGCSTYSSLKLTNGSLELGQRGAQLTLWPVASGVEAWCSCAGARWPEEIACKGGEFVCCDLVTLLLSSFFYLSSINLFLNYLIINKKNE
jgi:hypothetical protein